MRPHPWLRSVLTPPLAALLGAGLLAVAGCGPPPQPPGSADPTVAIASPVPPTFAPPASVPAGPAPLPATGSPGFAEDRAVSCEDEPAGSEIIALLRAEELLAADDDATVAEGPLCAGTWQYSVVDVPDLDPLQVVTRGEPGDLELVTAGTDVCTVDVRVQAPSGLRVAADCVG